MAYLRIALKVLSFITRLLPLIRRFTGKTEIADARSKSTQIIDAISRAARIPELIQKGVVLEIHYNDWVSKTTTLSNAYDDWKTAKQNYDSSNSDVTRYTRLLRNARRARSSSQISRYTTLLSRARTSRTRRQAIMNTKFNTMMLKARIAGSAAIRLLRDFKEIKSLLVD